MSTESNPAAAETLPENLVEAGVYPNAADGFEHGLVVLAMGRPFWLLPAETGHRLLVEPNELEEVRRQLRCFDRESAGWPPAPIRDPAGANRVELFTPLLWSLGILAAFWLETSHPRWVELGTLDNAAVFTRGEWWRIATALFLHADTGHLISNALNGILVFSATVTTLGRRRGWLLIAAAAVLGNLASAALHAPGEYRSMGASTAVFAAVGLLTGRALRVVLRAAHPHRWRALYIPAIAGFTVLALYGAGGVQIDAVAHLTGFLAGTGIGLAFARPGRRASRSGS